MLRNSKSLYFNEAVQWTEFYIKETNIEINFSNQNKLGEENNMEQYVKKVTSEDSVSVCFYIEQDKILAIGNKINEINEQAYMNGYNWEAFFNWYLSKNAKDLLNGMDTDPEAGMYVAYYDLTPKNEEKADKFIEIITKLIENEEELYKIIRKDGKKIEWD